MRSLAITFAWSSIFLGRKFSSCLAYITVNLFTFYPIVYSYPYSKQLILLIVTKPEAYFAPLHAEHCLLLKTWFDRVWDFLCFKQVHCINKWISAFSLFVVFIIAQDNQDQPWSQNLLPQYDGTKFGYIFGDLQTAKK